MDCGASSHRILHRERGSLTGASSAGLINRVVIEDSVWSALPQMHANFQITSELSFPFMSWSDNLATIATKLEDAVTDMQTWHFYLVHMMGMTLKPDSFECISSSTKKLTTQAHVFENELWTSSHALKCLGTWITSTGECHTQAKALMASWNSAFWANSKTLTNRKAPITSRIRFWGRICFGIADHVWATLRPSSNLADTLEACLNRFIKFIVGVKPQHDEPPKAFCIRRNGIIAREKSRANFDMRLKWAKKLVTWVEHIHRHPENPSVSLTLAQGEGWLRERRREAGSFGSKRSENSGATNTRSGSGLPIRWGERWLEDIGQMGVSESWSNLSKSKRVSNSRANALKMRYLTRQSPMLSLMDDDTWR